jgi:hypothetical protein
VLAVVDNAFLDMNTVYTKMTAKESFSQQSWFNTTTTNLRIPGEHRIDVFAIDDGGEFANDAAHYNVVVDDTGNIIKVYRVGSRDSVPTASPDPVNVGLIIGCVVGAVVLIVAIIGGIYCYVRAHREPKVANAPTTTPSSDPQVVQPTDVQTPPPEQGYPSQPGQPPQQGYSAPPQQNPPAEGQGQGQGEGGGDSDGPVV